MIQQSSELIVVDSSSNMDEHNMRVLVITSDEQMETLSVAVSLLKSIFPDDSFFWKNMSDVIMIDNCSELREALSEVFPTSNVLFCSFYIL